MKEIVENQSERVLDLFYFFYRKPNEGHFTCVQKIVCFWTR
ncbi:hypothetical protein MC28_E096 (plasmid) [Bacillus thuringiensis MC28]|nr:hypothetical protein MC28_E096 [Bacillus thuringiensis MC28]